MLQIKHGDLFDNVKKNAIIVHGCNAQGKMGSGFAKLIRDKYPDSYEFYKWHYDNGLLKLGSLINFPYVESGIWICHAITQEYYGNDGRRYVDYDAATEALNVTAGLSRGSSKPIHLPLIGCGLAGGDKAVMMGIFKEVFRDVDATLWIKED